MKRVKYPSSARRMSFNEADDTSTGPTATAGLSSHSTEHQLEIAVCVRVRAHARKGPLFVSFNIAFSLHESTMPLFLAESLPAVP